ncbi:hypothetical protein Tco_1256540 [Tanacetum coccineum]
MKTLITTLLKMMKLFMESDTSEDRTSRRLPKKNSKKFLEQERLGLEEAIRLQEQVDEDERAQIARDEEMVRQLLALDKERVTTESRHTRIFDWMILHSKLIGI